MVTKTHESWEEFLDPAIMRPRLIAASIFIAALEIYDRGSGA